MAGKAGFLASRSAATPHIRTPQFRDLRKALSFAFKIKEICPSYSVRMEPKGANDRMTQHVEYEIATTCLSPAKYAGRETGFFLIGATNLLEAEYVRGASIGRLTMRGKVSDYTGTLPSAELHHAMSHALSGRYRYITLIADAPGRSSATVHVLGFEQSLEPESYPHLAFKDEL